MANNIALRKFKLIELIMQLNSEQAIARLEKVVKKVTLTKQEVATNSLNEAPKPYIQWAETPEQAANLFGIWKETPKTIAQLRNLAWGGRV